MFIALMSLFLQNLIWHSDCVGGLQRSTFWNFKLICNKRKDPFFFDSLCRSLLKGLKKKKTSALVPPPRSRARPQTSTRSWLLHIYCWRCNLLRVPYALLTSVLIALLYADVPLGKQQKRHQSTNPHGSYVTVMLTTRNEEESAAREAFLLLLLHLIRFH